MLLLDEPLSGLTPVEALSGVQLIRDVRARGVRGTGTLELLTAPSLGAGSGVTLAGQSFGASTTTGLLAGAPRTFTVAPAHGAYALRVPPATAAMLTLAPN